MTRKQTASGKGSTEPPLPPIGEAWPGRRVRHGTPSGWRRHQNEGTDTCDACAQAKANYDWRWRNSSDHTQKNRLRAKAQSLALTRLRNAHQEEYDELYAAEAERLFKEQGLPVPKMRRRT